MRVALGQLREIDKNSLQFARQLGLKSVQFNNPKLPGDYPWSYKTIRDLKNECKEYDLKLEAIENIPHPNMDKIILNLEGRDQEIENYKTVIRNMGKAGIPILGFRFFTIYWRTSTVSDRGGIKAAAFEKKLAKNNINLKKQEHIIRDENIIWNNYRYFMKEIMPVAENCGVKLALHPDDPPLKSVGGIARIFHNFQSFKKAMKIADSDMWGLDLCLGSLSEMEKDTDELINFIKYFGNHDKIIYVHFRDVKGQTPNFTECFLGDGNYNPSEILIELDKVGFDGFLIDDHVPELTNDTVYGHRARAYTIGYIKGLLNSLDFYKTKME